MVSGTIADGTGTTTRYDEYPGSYCQYLEFTASGSLEKSFIDGTRTQGVYTFNDASRALSCKYDGDMYYYNATVSVISPSEMNMTTDYGSARKITQDIKEQHIANRYDAYLDDVQEKVYMRDLFMID